MRVFQYELLIQLKQELSQSQIAIKLAEANCGISYFNLFSDGVLYLGFDIERETLKQAFDDCFESLNRVFSDHKVLRITADRYNLKELFV